MNFKKLSFGLALTLGLSVPCTVFGVQTIWDEDSKTAFSAMPSGTVVLGSSGYDLNYANDAENQDEISSVLEASNGKVYVKGYDGNWIDNIKGLTADMSHYADIAYRSKTGDAVYPNTCTGLTVLFKSDPDSHFIMKGQSLVNVGTIMLTAGSCCSNVKITGLKITRKGLSADSDIEGITIWDGSTKISLLTVVKNGIADITFISPLTVNVGQRKTLTLKMDVSATAAFFSQIIFGLNDENAIKTETRVAGIRPKYSYVMTVTK